MSRAQKTDEDQKLMDEWLAKGNKVQVLPAHARTEPEDIVYTFKVGNRGRKAAPKPDAKPDAK